MRSLPLLVISLAGCARIGWTPVGDRAADRGQDLAWLDQRRDAPRDGFPHDRRAEQAVPSDLPGHELLKDLSKKDVSKKDLAKKDLAKDLGPSIDAPPLSAWVEVSAATFMMGSPPSDTCNKWGNEARHQVTLTTSFLIAATKVTQMQFQATMGYNPSLSACGGCPVDYLSWHEAVAYCNQLSAAAQLPRCYTCTGSGASVSCSASSAYAGKGIYGCPGYRLPTEAEWELAHRGGTTTEHFWGPSDPATCDECKSLIKSIDPYAWYCGNSGNAVHPVGTRKPNPFGLYDMAGNLYEWCHDGYTANLGTTAVTDPVGTANDKVTRGGSFGSPPHGQRAASRAGSTPGFRDGLRGVRCVRSILTS